MGRHVLGGELATTLWNQPYNGALDAYLLAPLLAVLPHHAAYRLYELLCAALLVVLVGLLARRLGGPTAGWAGALLAAWGTPYMALMTATGPPPNFLMPLVTGFPLVVALATLPRDGALPRRGPSAPEGRPLGAGRPWPSGSPAASPCGTPRSRSPPSPAWRPGSPSPACGRGSAPRSPSPEAWRWARRRSSWRG